MRKFSIGLIVVGVLLLLFAVAAQLDYITTQASVPLGTMILSVISIGVGIFAFIFDKKNTKNTPKNIAFDGGQIGDRNVTTEKYFEKIENYYEASNLIPSEVVLDEIQLNILKKISNHQHGIEFDLIEKQSLNTLPTDNVFFNYHIQKLLDLKLIKQEENLLIIDDEGVSYLYRTKSSKPNP